MLADFPSGLVTCEPLEVSNHRSTPRITPVAVVRRNKTTHAISDVAKGKNPSRSGNVQALALDNKLSSRSSGIRLQIINDRPIEVGSLVLPGSAYSIVRRWRIASFRNRRRQAEPRAGRRLCRANEQKVKLPVQIVFRGARKPCQ